MRPAALASLFVFAISPVAAQQLVPEASLNDQQKRGRDLFAQHCVVCHMRTLINSPGHWAPALSNASLGGNANVLKEVIGNGTPNMPGFRHMFTPAQIDDIVSYVRAFPAPPAPQPQNR
jgi:mono/diheme cytochrome c family protein